MSLVLGSHVHVAATVGILADQDRMVKPQHPPLLPTLEQVYLIERDAGLLCRILGLYASRGIEVLRADYACAAQDVMTLQVCVAARSEGDAEILRVLVDKAASVIGVLAATEQSAGMQTVA